jgi:hypothetical protein
VFVKNWGAFLIRKEAISFLKELAEKDLVLAFMVDIQRRTPNHYQLRIKGNYEPSRIKKFLNDKGFSFEVKQDTLVVFKP